MIDYMVVGLGLAGTAFCETLRKNNKSFVVFNDASQTSSSVAGGLYNPVILKRFTLSWKATQQLAFANTFYNELQDTLKIKFDHQQAVYRRFTSIEEQNLWFEATDKIGLQKYLSTELISNQNSNIRAPYGFGKVLHTGRLDTKLMLNTYQEKLLNEGILKSESFDYYKLEIHEGSLFYGHIEAKSIVFAEGFGLMKNPFFNYLPMQGSKGEYLIIKSKELKEKNAVKASIFLIPLGNDLYKVGANYNREDKTNTPTSKAKIELKHKLDAFLDCDYEIVNQVAGVRPTVKDRRPLLGRHPDHKNLCILNGFGSHGIMTAPWAAKALYDYLEKGQLLDKEMNIERFIKEYSKN